MGKKVNAFDVLKKIGFGEVSENIFTPKIEDEIKFFLKTNFNIELHISHQKNGEYARGFCYTISGKGWSSQRYGFRIREHAIKNALSGLSNKIVQKKF